METLQLKLSARISIIIQVHDVLEITSASHEEAKLIQWFHIKFLRHL